MCIGYNKVTSSGGNNPPEILGIGEGRFPELERQPPELKAKQENWEEIFGTMNPDGFAKLKSKKCLILIGSNLQNPTVRIGENNVQTVMITLDGKRLYFVPDDDSKVLFARKLISVTVTNHTKDSQEVGFMTYGDEAKSETDMGWEEDASRKVHDYLRSEEGQKAIRDYRDRNWAPVKPKFRLQILDKTGTPIEETLIRIENEENKWTDMTDSNGEIQIYQGDPTSYQVDIPGYCKVPIKVIEIKQYNRIIVDHFQGQKIVMIQFSDG
jgi:hypothetical protein